MLLVILPLAVVLSSVNPLVDSVPFHFVLDEVTLEGAPIRPNKLPMSMLLAMTVVTFKDCTVRPDFLAKAVVFVIDPIAVIVRTINVSVLALAI